MPKGRPQDYNSTGDTRVANRKAEDAPLGTGMADQAKKKVRTRKRTMKERLAGPMEAIGETRRGLKREMD